MSGMSERGGHVPVMLSETVAFFEQKRLEVFFEGTVGGGGHAKEILQQHPELKRYLACDQDQEALQAAKEALAPWKEKVELIHGNFSLLDHFLQERGIDKVDGFFLIWGSHPSSWNGERGDLVS